MPAKTHFVSYRISSHLGAELKRQAKETGQSPNGYACAALIEKLDRSNSEMHALELQSQIQKLRSDLAVATEALLTVIGGTKESGPRAAAWVKRNLNQK